MTTLCSECETVLKLATPAAWRNQNGVKVCDWHKLLLDAFTWETRNERRWTRLDRRKGE